MRLRSCFLYTVAFFVVGTVCVVIAASTVTNANRAASVKRLKATLVEKGVLPTNDPAPEKPADSTASPPGKAPLEAVQRDFSDVMARYRQEAQGDAWKAAWDLFYGDIPPETWTEAQWVQMSDFVAANQEFVEEIRRIAATGQPLVTLERPLTFQTSLEHLQVARGMARMLAMDALVGGHAGDADRIIADVEACLGLAHAVAQDGVVISGLVSIAITGMAHDALRDAIAPGSLTGQQTAALVETLAGAYGHETFVIGLGGEATMGMNVFDGIRNGDIDLSPHEAWLGALYGSALARPLLNIDEEAHAEAMEALIAAADRPFYEVRAEIEAMEARVASRLPFLRPITGALTPALSQVLAAQARNVAQVDLMRMGLLLEQQYADTGQYPESLDAIAPGMGGSLPVDPFTGTSYRYLPQGSTFHLYSMGLNGTDEGGAHDWQAGDWVWRGREVGDLRRDLEGAPP